MTVTPGRFITLEGGEGTGKSTQARRRCTRLRDAGLDVVQTREPGGSPGAEQIRKLVVEGEGGRWNPITETLLVYAARADHVARTIGPALAQGQWVVCDRFFDSSRAYQGAAGGAPASLLKALEADVVGDVVPDLTLILDLPPGAGLARAMRRGEGEGRFEAKGAEFHERLRTAFLDIASAEPQRCQVIDAEGDIESVAAHIWAAVRVRLGVGADG